MKKIKTLIFGLISLLSLSSCNDLNQLLDENTKSETTEEKKEENTENTETKESEEKPNEEEKPTPEKEVEETKYTVSWYNGSTLLKTDKDIKKGTVISYSGETPKKETTEQYTYTFVGWNTFSEATTPLTTLPTIESNTIFYAIFSSNIRSYNVTWMNGSTKLDTTTVEYGTKPVYQNANPVKKADSQYTYTFIGWNTVDNATIALDLGPVTKDITYYAVYTNSTNLYTVKWMNGSTELSKSTVEYNTIPVFNSATPTKEATAQYTYSFIGWNTIDNSTSVVELKPVTKDVTYYAVFSSTLRSYTITWKDDTGNNSYTTKTFTYGTAPVYPGTTPTKSSTNQYTYSFVGWSNVKNASSPLSPLPSVTKDETYYAVFSSTVRKYRITWKNGSTELASEYYEYNSTPKYKGTTPTKASTNQYSYTFIGWNTNNNATVNSIGSVTKDVVYYAIYKQEVRKFEVVFLNLFGREIDKQQVEYNKKPSTTKLTNLDIKEDYLVDTYTFIGWSTIEDSTTVQYTNSTLPLITQDTTFYCVYDVKPNLFDVYFYLNELGTEYTAKQLPYGAIESGEFPKDVKLTKEYNKYLSPLEIYQFSGWYRVGINDSLTTDDMLCKTNKVNVHNLVNSNNAECMGHCKFYPIFEPKEPEEGCASYKKVGDSEYTTFTWAKFVSEGYVSVTNNVVKGNISKLNSLNDLHILLPRSITGLADDAFNGATSLKYIYFGNSSLNLIGARAFKNCKEDLFYAPLIFNTSVEIKAEAFSGLKFADIVFDAKVIKIHTDAFKGVLPSETSYQRRVTLTFRVGNYTEDEYDGGIFANNWHGGSYLRLKITINNSYREKIINN